MTLKIGIDVGGTFTDFVVTRDGEPPQIHKTLSTPSDPSVAVVDGLAQIAAAIGTKEFVGTLPQWMRLRAPDRDTVLYPEISYPTYEMGAILAGCRAVPVPTSATGGLQLDAIDAKKLRQKLAHPLVDQGEQHEGHHDHQRDCRHQDVGPTRPASVHLPPFVVCRCTATTTASTRRTRRKTAKVPTPACHDVAVTTLEDAHVLITGGSQGIGFATAQRVLDRGGRVSTVARDAEKLAVAEDALESRVGDPTRVCAQTADVTDREGFETALGLLDRRPVSARHGLSAHAVGRAVVDRLAAVAAVLLSVLLEVADQRIARGRAEAGRALAEGHQPGRGRSRAGGRGRSCGSWRWVAWAVGSIGALCRWRSRRRRMTSAQCRPWDCDMRAWVSSHSAVCACASVPVSIEGSTRSVSAHSTAEAPAIASQVPRLSVASANRRRGLRGLGRRNSIGTRRALRVRSRAAFSSPTSPIGCW